MRPTPTERSRTTPRTSTRTCVGCGALDAPSAMLRLVVAPPPRSRSEREGGDEPRRMRPGTDEGESAPSRSDHAERPLGVAFDLAGGAFGRGAHVHARVDCLEKAPRGLARAFRREVAARPADLGRLLAMACGARMAGLLLAARRRGDVIVGTDASLEALRAGATLPSGGGAGGGLVIVATDAGAVASRREVAQAVSEGRAIAWGEKIALGALFGDQEVAICVVCHGAIAAELKRVRAAADAGATVMGTETATRREGAGCSRRPEAR